MKVTSKQQLWCGLLVHQKLAHGGIQNIPRARPCKRAQPRLIPAESVAAESNTEGTGGEWGEALAWDSGRQPAKRLGGEQMRLQRARYR